MHFWSLVSRLGESTCLLPCAMFIALWLGVRGRAGSALHWLALVACAAGVTLASKLAFLGWGIGIEALDFTGFSGHSTMAATVLPVLLYLCLPAWRPWVPRAGAALGIAVALLVGWSRLELNAHSPSEVVSGLALGLSASMLFLGRPHRGTDGDERLPHGVVPLAVALAVFGAVHMLPHWGVPTRTHVLVEKMAVYLSGRTTPYRRPAPVRAEYGCVSAGMCHGFSPLSHSWERGRG